jgi:hypothetical protein
MDHVKPATAAQLRALHARFAALGYTRRSDRPARLTAAATLLGIEHLDSFTGLSSGQAGILLRRAGELPTAGQQTSPAAAAETPPGLQISTSGGDLGLGLVYAWAIAAAAITLARALRQHWQLLADQPAYRSMTCTRPAPKNARAAS